MWTLKVATLETDNDRSLSWKSRIQLHLQFVAGALPQLTSSLLATCLTYAPSNLKVYDGLSCLACPSQPPFLQRQTKERVSQSFKTGDRLFMERQLINADLSESMLTLFLSLFWFKVGRSSTHRTMNTDFEGNEQTLDSWLFVLFKCATHPECWWKFNETWRRSYLSSTRQGSYCVLSELDKSAV